MINLIENHIEYEGVKAICELLKLNCSLESLDIGGKFRIQI